MPATGFDCSELTGLVMVPEFIAAMARGTRGKPSGVAEFAPQNCFPPHSFTAGFTPFSVFLESSFGQWNDDPSISDSFV